MEARLICVWVFAPLWLKLRCKSPCCQASLPLASLVSRRYGPQASFPENIKAASR